MEGTFSDIPEEDGSLDLVGNIAAVRALIIIFHGKNVEESKIREMIDNEELPEFSMVQIAIFSTVVCFFTAVVVAPLPLLFFVVIFCPPTKPAWRWSGESLTSHILSRSHLSRFEIRHHLL
jgi:hypothetical protein